MPPYERMRRRRYLAGIGSLATVSVVGCITSILPDRRTQRPASEVFAGFRYDRTELVVELREQADIQSLALVDPSKDDPYEVLDRPSYSVRFRVVFPDRLATYVTARPGLRVRAETADGVARQIVWEPVHGVASLTAILPDGRVRFEIENQGKASLLARFVGIYGDVPNPTVNLQADGFERRSLGRGPGIVGIGENRPLTPSRTDLVVPGGESNRFETTYAPFAIPNARGSESCDGEPRTAQIGVVQASGQITAYDFTYQLDGDRHSLEGPSATVCEDIDLS